MQGVNSLGMARLGQQAAFGQYLTTTQLPQFGSMSTAGFAQDIGGTLQKKFQSMSGMGGGGGGGGGLSSMMGGGGGGGNAPARGGQYGPRGGGGGGFTSPIGGAGGAGMGAPSPMAIVFKAAANITGAITSLITAGRERQAVLKDAYYVDKQAEAAGLQGRAHALGQLEGLNRSLASQTAAVAASGIGFTGSPVSNIKDSERRGESDIALTEATTATQVAVLKAQAKEMKAYAKKLKRHGLIKAWMSMTSLND